MLMPWTVWVFNASKVGKLMFFCLRFDSGYEHDSHKILCVFIFQMIFSGQEFYNSLNLKDFLWF